MLRPAAGSRTCSLPWSTTRRRDPTRSSSVRRRPRCTPPPRRARTPAEAGTRRPDRSACCSIRRSQRTRRPGHGSRTCSLPSSTNHIVVRSCNTPAPPRRRCMRPPRRACMAAQAVDTRHRHTEACCSTLRSKCTTRPGRGNSGSPRPTSTPRRACPRCSIPAPPRRPRRSQPRPDHSWGAAGRSRPDTEATRSTRCWSSSRCPDPRSTRLRCRSSRSATRSDSTQAPRPRAYTSAVRQASTRAVAGMCRRCIAAIRNNRSLLNTRTPRCHSSECPRARQPCRNGAIPRSTPERWRRRCNWHPRRPNTCHTDNRANSSRTSRRLCTRRHRNGAGTDSHAGTSRRSRRPRTRSHRTCSSWCRRREPVSGP